MDQLKLRRVAVCTTTIHVPEVLRQYAANAEAHGHGGRVTFVVAGDLQTPPECAQLCAHLQEAGTVRVVYLDVATQVPASPPPDPYHPLLFPT